MSGSYVVYLTVPCERCSADPPVEMFTYFRGIPRAKFAKLLERAGWKREGDGWLCRACQTDVNHATVRGESGEP